MPVNHSLISTLLHTPAFLLGGVGLETLAFIFVSAVGLSLVYVRTANSFLAMGVHALANFSVPVFAVSETVPYDLGFVWQVAVALVVIAWPQIPPQARRLDEATVSTPWL